MAVFFAGYASHAVFSSFVGWPVLPSILVGMLCAAVAFVWTGRRHPCCCRDIETPLVQFLGGRSSSPCLV